MGEKQNIVVVSKADKSSVVSTHRKVIAEHLGLSVYKFKQLMEGHEGEHTIEMLKCWIYLPEKI